MRSVTLSAAFAGALMTLVLSSPSDAAPTKRLYQSRIDMLAKCEAMDPEQCVPLRRLVAHGDKAISALEHNLLEGAEETRSRAASALGWVGGHDAIKALMRALSTERKSKIRGVITSAIERRHKEDVVGVAMWLLRSNEPTDRIVGANATGMLRIKEASTELVAATEDDVPRVQYAALSAMGKLGDASPIDPLINLVGDPQKPWTIRHKAIVSLGQLGARHAAPVLVAQLAHDEAALRNAAAKVLGDLGAKYAIPALVALLEQADSAAAASLALATMNEKDHALALVKSLHLSTITEEDRYQVLWAIGMLQNPAAIAPMAELLKDADPKLAYQVAHAIGRVGHRSGLTTLIPLLSHNASDVRDITLWSLEHITDQHLGYEPEAWTKWLEANPL